MNKKCALIILDGWGFGEPNDFNGIYQANTPNFDFIYNHYSCSLLKASGLAVGLPEAQMGNSEVGHSHIGSGRILNQKSVQMTIDSKDDMRMHPLLQDALISLKKSGRRLHILGLLSDGGVHSHEEHLFAVARLGANFNVDTYLHAFLDGRDTLPGLACESILKAKELSKTLPHFHLASICGRFYAMDRDSRWERIQKTYDLLTLGLGHYYSDALEALKAANIRGETDEFVSPSLLNTDGLIEDGDVVVFMNFRADRARQLSSAFSASFSDFNRTSVPKLSSFITAVEYDKNLELPVLYPPSLISNTLGEWLSIFNKRQLRISETEKYAHVTFFLNGGVEKPFPFEDRILIPSPKVKTYDLQPEMNCKAVTDAVIRSVLEDAHDVIICNYPNADMVGHTGNLKAVIDACEALDFELGRLLTVFKTHDIDCLVTADHGNAELMYNMERKLPCTTHTTNLVPCIYVGEQGVLNHLGSLIDLAPTLIDLVGLDFAPDMTGVSLLVRDMT